MDETPPRPSDNEPYREHVVAKNHWLQLADVEQGFGIWPADADRVQPAIELFGNDDFEAAEASFRRRTRNLRGAVGAPRWLALIVFVTAPLWAVATIVNLGWFYLEEWSFMGDSGPPTWLQLADQALNTVMVAALACLIAMFLLRRATQQQAS